MKIELLLPRVLTALREQGLTDKDIKSLTPQSAFNKVCDYEGMIGWGPVLWGWHENLEIAYNGGKDE